MSTSKPLKRVSVATTILKLADIGPLVLLVWLDQEP